MKNKYKPFISTDEEYLKRVAETIKGKQPLEEIKFEYLTETLTVLGFSGDPYDLVSLENLNPEPIQSLVNDSFQKINSTEITTEIKEKLFRLWDYLAEADPLQKSDLIFVFGGGGETRPKEAAKLYKEGWAPKVLFTGKKASYMEDIEVTEAEAFTRIAEKEGVPANDIILEKESLNTIENVTKSVALLKKLGSLPRRIILIQITYQMRRAYLTFKAVADWSPELIKHPAASTKFKREDYFMNKDGWSYIFFEFIKLYGARLMKHF